MNDKTNALILAISDYKESDILMQTITKDYGVVSFIGKASKKVESKNHFLNFCEYEFLFDYKDTKTIFTVHNAKLVNSNFKADDLMLLSFKNMLAELSLKNKEIASYEYLSFIYKNITNDNMYLLGSMYVSHLIKKFGITPVVDSCVVCGQKKVISISNKLGGFLCLDHLNGEKVIDVIRLKKFRMIVKAELQHYDILNEFSYDYYDYSLILDFFLSNSELKLKTYEFYKTLV